MGYRIEQQESVQAAVQRIAREQIDRAIAEIEDDGLGQAETVHQVRKRGKKIRGLIRLVRPQFEQTYQFENGWYRDAAHTLSSARDAQTIVKTFDDLLDTFDKQVDAAAFQPIGATLRDQRARVYDQSDALADKLEHFATRLHEGRRRIDDWVIKADGYEAVEDGLAKTYARGRKAMSEAYAKGTTEALHEWRKRVKYHWYHARLLQSVWPEVMRPYAKQVHLLSDILGDDHDLGVLRQTLTSDTAQFRDALEANGATLQVLIGLIDRRRVVLQAQARPLGLRLFCSKAKRLAKRFGCYWDAWHLTPDRLV